METLAPFLRTDLLLVVSLLLLEGVLPGNLVKADFEEKKLHPCTGGYGLREEANDLLELEDNEGCNFLNGEVPFFDDTCIKLLEQGPCRHVEWLVIDPREEIVQCKRRACPDGSVLYQHHCHSLDPDSNPCQPTFELIINQHGIGECECRPGHLYYPPTNRCYVPYTQGPCRPGFIIKLKVHDHGGEGRCERNPCPREKMTPLDHRCLPRDNIWFAKCYTIGQREPCTDDSYLLIDNSLAKPFCLPYEPNSITAPRFKRGAPCVVGHRNYCARKCDSPKVLPFRGSCGRGYTFMIASGRAQCVRIPCPHTSF